MALVLVLIMLVLLSILGTMVFTSTTSDLRITSNYRNLDNSFYAADAALEFAEAHALIYTSLVPSTSNFWPREPSGSTHYGVLINDDGTLSTTPNTDYPDYNRITIYKDAAKTKSNYAHVKVEYVGTGSVPPGMGTEVDVGLGSGTGFKANFYALNVIADGQTANNNSHVELESHIVRVVPK